MAMATVRCSAAISDGGAFLVSATERKNATLIARDGNSFNPADLSSITKLAAIGDSYSAGIGAGQKLGSTLQFLDLDRGKVNLMVFYIAVTNLSKDYACNCYNHLYPYLINYNKRLGDSLKRKFQFKLCSGAIIGDVLRRQIPALDSNQQVILLSARMYLHIHYIN